MAHQPSLGEGGVDRLDRDGGTVAEEIRQQLIEAWETNQRVHRMLLEAIPKEGFGATLSARGGRNVARQFAHLHTQRVRCIEGWGRADLAEPLPRFESREVPSREQLIEALDASAAALSELFRAQMAGEHPVRSQKKGTPVSIAYLIAHESHHRGSILLTLKQTGYRVEKKVLYGIWDWHRR